MSVVRCPPTQALTMQLYMPQVGKRLLPADLQQLPLILGAVYNIDHYQLNAQFDLKATSPRQKCDPASQGSQRYALSKSVGLPGANISSFCDAGAGPVGGVSVIDNGGGGGGVIIDVEGLLGGGGAPRQLHRRHLFQATQTPQAPHRRHLFKPPQAPQAPHRRYFLQATQTPKTVRRRHLFQDASPVPVPACQSVASMEIALLLDPGTAIGDVESQVEGYAQAARSPCVSPGTEKAVSFSVDTVLNAAYPGDGSGQGVECQLWSKTASKALSAEEVALVKVWNAPSGLKMCEDGGGVGKWKMIGIIVGCTLLGLLFIAGAIVAYWIYKRKVGELNKKVARSSACCSSQELSLHIGSTKEDEGQNTGIPSGGIEEGDVRLVVSEALPRKRSSALSPSSPSFSQRPGFNFAPQSARSLPVPVSPEPLKPKPSLPVTPKESSFFKGLMQGPRGTSREKIMNQPSFLSPVAVTPTMSDPEGGSSSTSSKSAWMSQEAKAPGAQPLLTKRSQPAAPQQSKFKPAVPARNSAGVQSEKRPDSTLGQKKDRTKSLSYSESSGAGVGTGDRPNDEKKKRRKKRAEAAARKLAAAERAEKAERSNRLMASVYGGG
eukprot:gene17141-23446_t